MTRVKIARSKFNKSSLLESSNWYNILNVLKEKFCSKQDNYARLYIEQMRAVRFFYIIFFCRLVSCSFVKKTFTNRISSYTRWMMMMFSNV